MFKTKEILEKSKLVKVWKCRCVENYYHKSSTFKNGVCQICGAQEKDCPALEVPVTSLCDDENDYISYANKQKGICPKCGSTNLDFSKSSDYFEEEEPVVPERDDMTFGFKFICEDCGAVGYEWVNLVFRNNEVDSK